MVKQSHYGPGQALRVPGGRGSQIWRQSAYKGGKVVSHRHRPSLPLGEIFLYSCLLEVESTRAIVGQLELRQWKIPVTQSRIEPATFRHVAQCLDQQRHRVPHLMSKKFKQRVGSVGWFFKVVMKTRNWVTKYETLDSFLQYSAKRSKTSPLISHSYIFLNSY